MYFSLLRKPPWSHVAPVCFEILGNVFFRCSLRCSSAPSLPLHYSLTIHINLTTYLVVHLVPCTTQELNTEFYCCCYDVASSSLIVDFCFVLRTATSNESNRSYSAHSCTWCDKTIYVVSTCRCAEFPKQTCQTGQAPYTYIPTLTNRIWTYM